MTALTLAVHYFLALQVECVFVAMAWESGGESQGTVDAKSPPRWLTGWAGKADKCKIQKKLRQRGDL